MTAPTGPRPTLTSLPAAVLPRVEQLLSSEPEHPERGQPFQQRPQPVDRRRLHLGRLVRAHWRLAAAAALLVGLIALSDQAGPRLVATAIDDGMVRQRSMRLIGALAGGYALAVLLSGYCQRCLVRVAGRLSAAVMYDVRVRVFTHLQRLSLDYYTREKAGVVMTRMTSDIENLQTFLQDGLAQVAVQALTMIVITALLVTLDARLALLTIALTVVPLLGLTWWFRTRSSVANLVVRDRAAAVLSDLSESLRGIRVVTGHNRGAYNTARHRTVSGAYRDANNAAARISSTYGAATQFIALASQVVLLGAGGQMVLDGRLTLGQLFAFFLYFNRFFQPIQLLVQQFTTYQQSRSSLVKLNDVLAEEPAVLEAEHAVELAPVSGDIRFEAVSFGYTDGSPVLRGIDLHIGAGQTVAFVGPTGAGKSTLARLAMRLYDVTDGRVLVDGHDVRDVTLDSLRRQVLLVPQESFLFAGTLRDNLRFGCPTASEAEVLQAVEAVGLTRLLTRLGGDLDTHVNERGGGLSAGERQLVALARAFLAAPRVLVLDEATANLDLQSEGEIELALDRLLRGRTSIVIAHRLTTAMRSDRVVVIEGGRVVEDGTPEELLLARGRFAAMHATWRDHA